MSSAGHVLDMIKRSSYNDSIRQKRIERIGKIKDIYQEEIRKRNHLEFQRKEISKDDLQKIKIRIRAQMEHKRKRAFVSTLIATLLVIGVSSLLFYLWRMYLAQN